MEFENATTKTSEQPQQTIDQSLKTLYDEYRRSRMIDGDRLMLHYFYLSLTLANQLVIQYKELPEIIKKVESIIIIPAIGSQEGETLSDTLVQLHETFGKDDSVLVFVFVNTPFGKEDITSQPAHDVLSSLSSHNIVMTSHRFDTYDTLVTIGTVRAIATDTIMALCAKYTLDIPDAQYKTLISMDADSVRDINGNTRFYADMAKELRLNKDKPEILSITHDITYIHGSDLVHVLATMRSLTSSLKYKNFNPADVHGIKALSEACMGFSVDSYLRAGGYGGPPNRSIPLAEGRELVMNIYKAKGSPKDARVELVGKAQPIFTSPRRHIQYALTELGFGSSDNFDSMDQALNSFRTPWSSWNHKTAGAEGRIKNEKIHLSEEQTIAEHGKIFVDVLNYQLNILFRRISGNRVIQFPYNSLDKGRCEVRDNMNIRELYFLIFRNIFFNTLVEIKTILEHTTFECYSQINSDSDFDRIISEFIDCFVQDCMVEGGIVFEDDSAVLTLFTKYFNEQIPLSEASNKEIRLVLSGLKLALIKNIQFVPYQIYGTLYHIR